MRTVESDRPASLEATGQQERFAAGRLAGLSAYWFGTNFHWAVLLVIVIPSQCRQISPRSPAETQGAILGWGALFALVVPLLAGAMSDRCRSRFGRRAPFMFGGVLLNLAGLAILFAAGLRLDFWLYLLGYFVIQTGNNIASAAYSGVIPDLLARNQRGEASGWMAVMCQTGTITGALAAGALWGVGNSLAAYTICGVLLTVLLFVTLAAMREQPYQGSIPPLDWIALAKSLWIDPRKHPDFFWVWVTRFLVTMGMFTFQQNIQYYLADVLGVKNPEAMAGYLLGAVLAGATITGFLGGRLSDRIGRKSVVYVSNGVIAGACVGFAVAQSLPMAFGLAAIYGLGYGAYYSVDWALGCDVLPNPEDAGKDMAVWHVAMTLPQSFAIPLAATVLGAFGRTQSDVGGATIYHYTHGGYAAMFLLAAGFLALGAVLLRNVRGVR